MAGFLPHQQLRSLQDAQENFDAIDGQGISSGTGAPTMQGRKGDYYFRLDTPAIANQRIYVNMAAGSNWTGIL